MAYDPKNPNASAKDKTLEYLSTSELAGYLEGSEKRMPVLIAKYLAHPLDKNIRDAGFDVVKHYLSNLKELRPLEMLKLHSGLHYSFWHSDKWAVQSELATRISNLVVDCWENHNKSFIFQKAFWETAGREYRKVDVHRTDKYLTLIRYFLRACFQLLENLKWKPKIVQAWIRTFKTTALNIEKTHRTIVYHIEGIWLEEIEKVTGGPIFTIPVESAIALLQPWFFRFSSSDMIEVNGVIDRVFNPFVESVLSFFSNSRCQTKDMLECWKELIKLVEECTKLFQTTLERCTDEENKEILENIVKQFQMEEGRRKAQMDLIAKDASKKLVKALEKPPRQRKSYEEYVEEAKERAKNQSLKQFTKETLAYLNDFYDINPTDYDPYERLNTEIHAFEKTKFVGNPRKKGQRLRTTKKLSPAQIAANKKRKADKQKARNGKRRKTKGRQ